jgi:hypothetical protein
VDLSLLKSFEQIAGLAGLSLGVVLLLFRNLLRQRIFPRLDRAQAHTYLSVPARPRGLDMGKRRIGIVIALHAALACTANFSAEAQNQRNWRLRSSDRKVRPRRKSAN